MSGTPFLFKDLKKAKIVMITGKVHDDIMANILPNKAELYVQLSPSNIVIPDISYIESILFIEDNTLYIPFEINNNRVYIQSVFEANGKKFFAFTEKKFVKANVGGAYNSGPKFDEYKEIITYYLFEDNELLEIKKGNSGIKLLAGESWKEARDFVKKENIDFNDVKDMVKLLSFIEKL
ncbi:hypothetical protein [Belliella baltica]|uniref:hypothetical protein n=1 Tax=Belliella baltica TaxID=232259 RepID=UPI0012F98B29|nr:hypothetical protein [Belliella baltica]